MRLAVRGGALGDVLLGIPTWRAVRDAAPSQSMVVAAPAVLAPLIRAALASEATPVVVTSLDDPAIASLHTAAVRTSTTVPDWAAVDCAVVWSRGHPEVASRLHNAGVRRVIGADPFPPVGGPPMHAADWLAATVADAGIGVPAGWDRVAWVTLPGAAPTAGSFGAIVHPGSGSGRKCWPPDRWRLLVESLLTEGWRVTVLEGEADAAAVEAVVGDALASWMGRVRVVRGESIMEVATRLQCAALVVANDSGIAHLAAGLGAPTVGIFGPTDPQVWRPRGPRVEVVGGTPGSSWPQRGEPPPSVRWPDVATVLGAIRRVCSVGAPTS